MPLFVRSTLCVTTLVCGMWVVAAAGLPNSWPSWLWIRQLSDPLLSVWPFLQPKNLFVFSTFFQFVPISLFKKEKLAKSDLFDSSDSHENFVLNRCAIKQYPIFSGHIGDGYREIQENGAHRRDLQTLAGAIGSGKNICWRSWNYLSSDAFLDPIAPAKVSNQVVQRDPTGGSRTLLAVKSGFILFINADS
jgi:hypothetical protein